MSGSLREEHQAYYFEQEIIGPAHKEAPSHILRPSGETQGGTFMDVGRSRPPSHGRGLHHGVGPASA